jgi:hypothetical protein
VSIEKLWWNIPYFHYNTGEQWINITLDMSFYSRLSICIERNNKKLPFQGIFCILYNNNLDYQSIWTKTYYNNNKNLLLFYVFFSIIHNSNDSFCFCLSHCSLCMSNHLCTNCLSSILGNFFLHNTISFTITLFCPFFLC